MEAAQHGRDAINCHSESADRKIDLGLQSQTSVRQAARAARCWGAGAVHTSKDVFWQPRDIHHFLQMKEAAQ